MKLNSVFDFIGKVRGEIFIIFEEKLLVEFLEFVDKEKVFVVFLEIEKNENVFLKLFDKIFEFKKEVFWES